MTKKISIKKLIAHSSIELLHTESWSLGDTDTDWYTLKHTPTGAVFFVKVYCFSDVYIPTALRKLDSSGFDEADKLYNMMVSANIAQLDTLKALGLK